MGVLLIATTSGAQALTVTRCNVLVDGTYKPVLVVEDNGTQTVHQIGEDGLTRRVLFDADAALQWAVQKYGADAASSSYGGTCLARHRVRPTRPALPPPPPMMTTTAATTTMTMAAATMAAAAASCSETAPA